jgi:hypothetical protein
MATKTKFPGKQFQPVYHETPRLLRNCIVCNNDLPLNGWKSGGNEAFRGQFTSCKCGAYYERNGETGKIYYQTSSGGERSEIKCVDCDSDVLDMERRHPVWDGPFPLSGSGRVVTAHIPYCPKCEEVPKERGSPIRPRGAT